MSKIIKKYNSLVKDEFKKPRKKKPLAGNRRTIVAVFVLTVLASLVFWLKTEWPFFWGRLTAPLIISSIPDEAKFDPSPVLDKIKELTKDLRGVYGVYVYRFEDGHDYGLYAEEIFPAASLMKLPVILTLYQEVGAGRIDLEAQYRLIQEDKAPGAGILYSQTAGATFTYRQLAKLMGQYSDNTAYRALLRILGREKVQMTIDDLGMRKTSLAENETSPEDIGLFFKKLWQGNLVNRVHRDEILEFLTDTGFEDRIPAGVPPGTRVAHKIGTEMGNYSDAGLVFGQEPLVLVIISKNAREAEALEVLPQITALVWEFEQGHSEL